MEELMKAAEGLTYAEVEACVRAYRAKIAPPLTVSDNASLCEQLAGITGLGTMREHRVKAARVATPPPGWSDADIYTPKEAMKLLSMCLYYGSRDLIVSLVGGPGTGKSYSVDQITSLVHATPEMKWASTTATVAVTFSDSMALDVGRGTSANMWEEVVIRILFSHYYADTGLSFTRFCAALMDVVDTAVCDESTATSVLRCVLADVVAQGKTTVLLAVDGLMRLDVVEKHAAATLLTVLAHEMDTMNRVTRQSMMLVVTSLSAAPLNAIWPPNYSSGRTTASVALPRLCGPSTVDLVLRRVSRSGDRDPTDALRSLVANLVAMCGGHPGTVELACDVLCQALAANPRQVSLPEVLRRTADAFVAKYKELASLTVPLVLAAWSGNALRSDHKVRVSVGGATDDTTVEKLVERGALFATSTHQGTWYHPRLSIVQLLAWAVSLKAREVDGTGATAAVDADRDIRSLVVDIIMDTASQVFLYGKVLEHFMQAALQLRMVLLASDVPKPVTWRSLLNVAPLPEGSRRKLNDAALDRKFLLLKRRDISTKRPTYTGAERKAAAWKAGKPLQARLKGESRQLKWLHPPPSTTKAFDLVMRCTEVVSTTEVWEEAGECVAFVQAKGLAGKTERAWSKAHKGNVERACQRCRASHSGKMVFIAAAYMDTPMPKSSLAPQEAATFILLDKQDCRRLMGTPLSMALDGSDRLARPRKQGGARGRVRAGRGAGNPGAGSPL